MKSLATDHAEETESSPQSSLLCIFMRHESTIPGITITEALYPSVAAPNAQTVTCLKDEPYHIWGAVASNISSSSSSSSNPLTLWDADHHNSLDASINSLSARDFGTPCDRELWDFSWADALNNVDVDQESVTIVSSQGTIELTHALPLAPKTSPPHLFQCYLPSTGKRSEETICGRIFPDKRGLTRHKRSVHTSNGYKCRCSNRLITRKDNHRRHVKSCDRVADPQQPVYICRCGTPNSNKDDHLRHIKTCTTNRSGGAGQQYEVGDAA